MDTVAVLTDILIVLVAAKVAAEAAERAGVPAVVGEIVAGVLIGPSLFGLVGHDETLRTLGEIGVILLLLEVGMEMDLGELGKVGRASLLVATVGVVVPMVLGLGTMQLLGADFNTSLFVGAALTATSVGITARVFGDLRALATTEARIVLGAAVADDVMGLVVLTVVVRLVTEGSVSVLAVAGIIGVAVAFLVVGAGVGLRLSGPLFAAVHRFSRSTGTMVALALAFTLAFARLADAARLAPIVGAFVAGLALTRSDQSERIRRELTPVGHLFIPVFFLQIGIDADISAFGRVTVLRDAALLLVVAAVGKLVSPVGALGGPGDKLLIGLGMLPRGEVGLIFATIGLANGILDDELYASLLLVILVTTLATPQLLKLRYGRIRASQQAVDLDGDPMPAEGWLRVSERMVELTARPPAQAGLEVALKAAVLVARNEPGPLLTEWLAGLPPGMWRWRADALDQLLDTIERGNARSWSFLDSTGVLPTVLPELAQAIRSRRADTFTVDPLEAYRFTGLEQLRRLDGGDPVAIEAGRILHPDHLLLVLLLAEVLDDLPDAGRLARTIVGRLGLDRDVQEEVGGLVEDRRLLWAAAHRADWVSEEKVLQLASHLDTPEQARILYVVSALLGGHRDRWEFARLAELHSVIEQALAQDGLSGVDARNLIGRRRTEAIAMAHDDDVRDLIARAPRAYVLRQPAPMIARHAQLVSPPLKDNEARVRVAPNGKPGMWWVDVAARDRHGLLAAVTGVLATHNLDVVSAVVATWPGRAALESFQVAADEAPDGDRLERDIVAAGTGLNSPPVAEATITFDGSASPWHTVCEVIAPDKPGLLHLVATAFAAGGVEVLSALVTTADGIADNRFEVVDRNGRKLDEVRCATVEAFLHRGVATGRHWFRSRPVPALPEPVGAS